MRPCPECGDTGLADCGPVSPGKRTYERCDCTPAPIQTDTEYYLHRIAVANARAEELMDQDAISG